MISPRKNIHPRRIRLDAATACQLKCPSCPTASGETGKSIGSGFLKFEDFKKIVDANPWVSHIELSNWGEIFLNKEIVKIMRYAYKHNVALSAANGANLNTVSPQALEGIVKYKMRNITCSIDGASQETYSQYRVKGDFCRVIENLKVINRWKTHYRSPFPLLRWQFVAFGHNEHEIAIARAMAKELGMEFFLKLSWGDMYRPDFSPVINAELIRQESGLGVANREEYIQKYGKSYAERTCCLGMWTSPQINYDGKVLGCCINYWGNYGNALESGVGETINSDAIHMAREMLMGKREAHSGIPCATCKVYERMKKDSNWIREEEVNKEAADKDVRSRFYIMVENKILGPQKTKRLAQSVYLWKTRLRSGEAFSQKKKSQSKKKCLDNLIHPFQLPLQPDVEKKWKMYPFFRGATKGIEDMSCHASALIPGHSPHEPHAHKEEEVLMMLSGEADLILPDYKGGNIRLKPGQFVYYPAGFYHTLRAAGDQPANYMMFKWYTPSSARNGKLGFGFFDINARMKETQIPAGFIPRLLFEGPTQCLKKLQCHTSTLTSGAGYKPHVDLYDVAIVMLEGEVETLGRRVGSPSVIYYPAGKPHGISNPGQVPAKYLVFEFHAE